MTDNELVRFFEKNDQKLCGRFRSDQLNKEIELPRIPNSFQKWKSVAAIAAGLLAWNAVDAQINHHQVNNFKVESTIEKENNNKSSINKLKGIVKDEKGEALIGVNILLGGNRGTVTDIYGKFELEIPDDRESVEITFSYLGYKTQVIEFEQKEISNGKLAEIRMVETNHQLSTLEVDVTAKRIELSKCEITTGRSIMYIAGGFRGVEVPVEKEKEKEKEKTEISQPISNIYPNPFVDYVNVMLELEKDQPYLFHLYNANGQLIWAKTYNLPKGKQELRLDFSNVRMAQGNHFLRITDGNREIQTKKIIKVNTKGEESVILSDKL